MSVDRCPAASLLHDAAFGLRALLASKQVVGWIFGESAKYWLWERLDFTP